MSDAAWLLGLEQFGIKFGLDNIQAITEELGHPELAYKTIHIAGTNGKGSVTAMVDAALRSAGYLSARYTSPHLLDITERFGIDGRPASRQAFEDATRDVRRAVDRLIDRRRLESPPTFFEATTAIAFELFRRTHVEIAVFEAGMGGRLDATNVVQPIATAITTIGFDHQQYLGGTLAAIAREKAGIVKPGVPVVVGRLDPSAREAIEAVAAERNAPVLDADDPPAALSAYPGVRLALAGDHQIANAAVAVRLLEAVHARGVPVPTRAIAAGLERVSWPGRLDTRRLAGGREVLLDAAHNPDGAAALAAFLTHGPGRPIVFAAMRDKDARGMLRALAPVATALVITRPSTARAADVPALAAAAREAAPGLRIVEAPDVREALAAAWSLSPRIVVAGSIFLLADVMNEIERS